MAKRAATDAYKNGIYDPKVEKTNKTLFEPNNFFFQYQFSRLIWGPYFWPSYASAYDSAYDHAYKIPYKAWDFL